MMQHPILGIVFFVCAFLLMLLPMHANSAEPPMGRPRLEPIRPIGYEEWVKTGEYPKRLVLPITDGSGKQARRTAGSVLLRSPIPNAHRPPALQVRITRRIPADAKLPWTEYPPIMRTYSTTGVDRKSALNDQLGSSYILAVGDVFPLYDQVLLVESIHLREATLAIVNDRLPKELLPGPRSRVLPMNMQNAGLFDYDSPLPGNTKKTMRNRDIVRVLGIDQKSKKAEIELTPKASKSMVLTVSKGGLLTAHGISYRVLNVVPPQDIKDVGHLVGWVELAPDPVEPKNSEDQGEP